MRLKRSVSLLGYFVFVLVLSLSPIINTSLGASNSGSTLLFYVYGTHLCPHCRHQVSFFEQYYPNNYYFCDVSNTRVCLDLYSLLIRETELQDAVPTTLVVRNGYVIAIVQGEVENTTFWNSFSNMDVTLTSIPLYYSNRLVGSVSISDPEKFASTFIHIVNQTTTSTTVGKGLPEYTSGYFSVTRHSRTTTSSTPVSTTVDHERRVNPVIVDVSVIVILAVSSYLLLRYRDRF